MPSITPSDGAYQNYKQSLEELESSYAEERKRAREREAERTQQLEEDQKESLANIERKYEKTMQNLREEAQEAFVREKENSKNDIARLKKQTYDRFGKANGLDAETLKEQLDTTKRTAEEQAANHRSAIERLDKQQEQKTDELAKDHQDALQKATNAARDSTSRALAAQSASLRENSNTDKNKIFEQFEEATQRQAEDMRLEQKRAETSVKEIKSELDRRLTDAEEIQHRRVENAERQAAENAREQALQERDSRAKETGELRRQLGDLVVAEKQYVREKGQGTQDAVREHSDEARIREETLSRSYERDIDNLKRQAKDSDRYFAKLNNEMLKDKERQFAKLFSQANNENHLQRKDMQKGFDEKLSQFEHQRKLEQEANDRYTREQVAQTRKTGEETLDSQASAYRDTLERNRISAQDEINRLQRQRDFLANSDDPSAFSPAAEASMRRDMMKEYAKLTTAEQSRSEAKVNLMQEQNRENVRELTDEYTTRETMLQQNAQMEQHRSRKELMQTIDDIQSSKETEIREKDAAQTRANESAYRNYAAMLERQRRQYEEILQTMKNDATTKQQALRQDLEFASKMQQREFATNQNQLIRDYEKRIGEQKTEYDQIISDLKNQTEQLTRENDKKNRQLLEEQARGYEQRLSQLEFQHKERERYVSQGFEDQMDKLKATNALLQKRIRV